jgi:hypothetical protein
MKNYEYTYLKDGVEHIGKFIHESDKEAIEYLSNLSCIQILTIKFPSGKTQILVMKSL